MNPDSPSSSSSKMESSITSLMFKGSIPEAIIEAKRQKKLFVVYISGEDDQSVRMESSTWMDMHVAESLSKYCILLQLSEGSTDAAQFSVIYPQKSVPCITAVGYNGMQLWQNEGFVSAEVLASTLEKAWLSLHIQETTATVLSAALASKKSEPSTSGTCDMASTGEESSSMDIASPSIVKDVRSPEDRPPATSEIMEENKDCASKVEDINTKLDVEVSSKSNYADELESGKDEQSASSTKFQRELAIPGEVDLENSGVGHDSLNVEKRSVVPVVDKNVIDHHLGISSRVSPMVIIESNEVAPDNKTEVVENKQADVVDIATSKLNEVHLNLRLPDGSTLQEKFVVTSPLRMVKDCVNKSQVNGLGSYDLAIPYPRKVFNDQDLSRSLSELGLLNRQALIVVPHQQASGHYRGGSSAHDQTNSTPNVDSSNGTNEGYFTYARSILSYLNPFSYLGGSASSSGSGQEPRNSMWQYGPNPTLQNTLRGTERTPYTSSSSNPTTSEASRNDRKNSRPSTSRIGSNIHTLNHDEDDGRFSDRNAFWNGNSTQYGGDNDGK